MREPPDGPSRIPYQPQAAGTSDRQCGAAALAMVYASLGLVRSQEAIWGAIREANPHGSQPARTHRLARQAIEEGLAALVVQAAQPWALLRHCWEQEVRVIVNHRLRHDSRLGHFSVLAGIDSDAIRLHDPQLGPDRRLSRQSFLKLWLPTAGGSEIAGNVLVAISRPGAGGGSCAVCGGAIPTVRTCRACGGALALQPAAALGCPHEGCPTRLWKYLFCPACDQGVPEVDGSENEPHSRG